MIITKRVYQVLTAQESKTGKEMVAPFDMYYKIGAGWVSQKEFASVFKSDEQVSKWLDVAFSSLKENEVMNILE